MQSKNKYILLYYLHMSTRPIIWLLMSIGGTIGSYIPTLWGDTSFLSFSGLFFGAIGSIIGIYIGFRISEE